MKIAAKFMKLISRIFTVSLQLIFLNFEKIVLKKEGFLSTQTFSIQCCNQFSNKQMWKTIENEKFELS